jgi:spermidine/putrescine transport system permease protein
MPERSLFKTVVISLVCAWILFFVFFPNLMVVVASFLERDPDRFVRPVPTLAHFRALLDPVYVHILLRSAAFALATTSICLVLAYPFAFALSRSRYRRLLLILVIIPFWTSSLVRTYALMVLLKANGLINTALMGLGLIDTPLPMLYTDGAVLVGLVYTLLPFMILPLYASLDKLDRRLVEAGYDLGASRRQVLVHVLVPATLPGIVAGSILVFLPTLGLFYIPDLLGGAKSMLVGNFIKNQFLTARNWPFGSAASLFLSLVMGLMLVGYWASMRRFSTDAAGGGLER